MPHNVARIGLSRYGGGDSAAVVKPDTSKIEEWKSRKQARKQSSDKYSGNIDNNIVPFPNKLRKCGLTRFTRLMPWKTDFRTSIRNLISDIIRKNKIDLADPVSTDAVRQCVIGGASDAGVEMTGSKADSQGAEPFVASPQSWEEAMAHISDLKSWAEYRVTNPDRSIIDYLADPDGLGRWTLSKPGIPRPALKKLYPITDPKRPEVGSPYKALENWLDRVAKKTGERKIPPYLHIPDVSAEIDRLAALDEVAGREPTARVDAVKRARARRQKNQDGFNRP